MCFSFWKSWTIQIYWIYAIDILIQYIFLKYLYYIYVYIHNIFGYGPTTHYLKGEMLVPLRLKSSWLRKALSSYVRYES